MSEIDKYEAQMKKLDGLCEEHDLTYRFNHNQYPITLTIRPLTGMDEQLSMLEQAESRDYISADASMVIYRKDGDLATKINGTFTIGESLRSKFKNIYLKLADFWLQYYQRDTLERNVVNGANMPVIDEGEAEDRPGRGRDHRRHASGPAGEQGKHFLSAAPLEARLLPRCPSDGRAGSCRCCRPAGGQYARSAAG